jgi:hypothetical protein
MPRHAYSTPALRALMLAAVLACSVAPPAAMAWPFGSEQVEGNGNVTRQARKVESFNGIALACRAGWNCVLATSTASRSRPMTICRR